MVMADMHILNGGGEISKGELKEAMAYGLSLNLKKLFSENWKVLINSVTWETTLKTMSWELDYDVVRESPYSHKIKELFPAKEF